MLQSYHLKNQKASNLKTIREFRLPEMNLEMNIISPEISESINQVIDRIQEQIPIDIEYLRTAEIHDIDVKAELKKSICVIAREIKTRYRTIKTIETSSEKIIEEKQKLSFKILKFDYKSKFQDEFESIKTLLETYSEKEN